MYGRCAYTFDNQTLNNTPPREPWRRRRFAPHHFPIFSPHGPLIFPHAHNSS
jgi:hypothetical protein